MFTIENEPPRRTIRLKMTGLYTTEEMKRACDELRRASASYGGAEHMVLADMRGLVTLPPELSSMLSDAIGYQRRHGVVLCAHLSDSSVVRLQTKRLAREATKEDRATIDVVSLEEAERVLEERRPRLSLSPGRA